jgi:hypothetical protein
VILDEDFFHPIHQGLEFKVGKFTGIKKNMTAGGAREPTAGSPMSRTASDIHSSFMLERLSG